MFEKLRVRHVTMHVVGPVMIHCRPLAIGAYRGSERIEGVTTGAGLVWKAPRYALEFSTNDLADGARLAPDRGNLISEDVTRFVESGVITVADRAAEV